LKAELEGGPGEQGEALAAAGVVAENEAVVERATGVVFKLETLEGKVRAARAIGIIEWVDGWIHGDWMLDKKPPCG